MVASYMGASLTFVDIFRENFEVVFLEIVNDDFD